MEIDPEALGDWFEPTKPVVGMHKELVKKKHRNEQPRHPETREERAERIVTEFKDSMLKKVNPPSEENIDAQQKLYFDYIANGLRELQYEKDPYFFTGNDLQVSGDNLEDRQATVKHLPTLIQVTCSSDPDGHKNVVEAKNVLHDFLAQHIKEWSKTSENFRAKFGIPTHFNDLDH